MSDAASSGTPDAASTWSQAFPWLDQALDSGEALTWAGRPIDGHSPLFVDQSSQVAALAIEQFKGWALFSLFPYIPDELEPSHLLSTRAINVLSHYGITTFGQLGERSVADLFIMRNAGAKTVEELVTQLVAANARSIVTGSDVPTQTIVALTANELICERDGQLPAGWQFVSKSLSVLAQWQRVRGRSDSSILDPEAFVGEIPQDVRHARDALYSLTAKEWLDNEHQGSTVLEIIDQHLIGLSAREQRILSARVLTEHPRTLDSLGVEFDVSRERVRQIEASLMSRVREWLSDESVLHAHALAVLQAVAGLARLEGVLDRFPDLRRPVSGTDLPAWYVLDKFDESFESDGEWIAAPSLNAIRDELHLRFAQAEVAPGLAPWSSLSDELSEWSSLTDEDLRDWLQACGYTIMHGHFLSPAVRSLPDRAAAYLRITGASTRTEDIYDEVGLGRSMVSLKNALGSDDRFVRVDKSVWGLREWGMAEYQGIREAVSDVVAAQGPTALDDLIREVTGQFDVSPRSIVAYANAWPLETVAGIVRFAEQMTRVGRSLSQTRHVYLRGSGWAFRTVVTTDHLRGSGFVMPSSLASALGLQPGEKATLNSHVSPLTISWRAQQPSFGSIRRHLVDIDAADGDEVVILLTNSDVRVYRIDPNLSPGDFLRAKLALDGTGPLNPSEVANSLGLASSAPWSSSIHVLRDRGERDVANALVKLLGDNMAFDEDLHRGKPTRFSIIAIDDQLAEDA